MSPRPDKVTLGPKYVLGKTKMLILEILFQANIIF